MQGEIKIGDRIKFKAATRSGNSAAWRKVNGFWCGNPDLPTVGFNGWSNFAVERREILEIEPA
jgi:hypothetical protein